jgi:hypothetical protein
MSDQRSLLVSDPGPTSGTPHPHEQGQASGAAAAVRELAIVLGVVVLASTFVAHGGYTSPAAFIGRLWLAAGHPQGCVLVSACQSAVRRPGRPR